MSNENEDEFIEQEDEWPEDGEDDNEGWDMDPEEPDQADISPLIKA